MSFSIQSRFTGLSDSVAAQALPGGVVDVETEGGMKRMALVRQTDGTPWKVPAQPGRKFGRWARTRVRNVDESGGCTGQGGGVHCTCKTLHLRLAPLNPKTGCLSGGHSGEAGWAVSRREAASEAGEGGAAGGVAVQGEAGGGKALPSPRLRRHRRREQLRR
ncbi:hypothetical protein HJG60_011715 [Phyllostomus discolor]|uniref:Uncharacterized protein n=1 Tax=Phyllostomus discolor TaxID=89673 RepID=A0A833ZUC3_9CHIR|nr:hypothetical protein HJG60_011715 [Phyllostomus discolor]